MGGTLAAVTMVDVAGPAVCGDTGKAVLGCGDSIPAVPRCAHDFELEPDSDLEEYDE